MACRFFVGEPRCHCTAVTAYTIPTIYERERFCRGADTFMRCPTYQAQSAWGRPLSADEYLCLWLPNADAAASPRRPRA